MMIRMDKKMLEDVLKFLTPYFQFSIRKSFMGNKKEVIRNITEGMKKGKIVFTNSLILDINKMEKERGKKWGTILKRQLKIFCETIEKT